MDGFVLPLEVHPRQFRVLLVVFSAVGYVSSVSSKEVDHSEDLPTLEIRPNENGALAFIYAQFCQISPAEVVSRFGKQHAERRHVDAAEPSWDCLLYTSDAADDLLYVDL